MAICVLAPDSRPGGRHTVRQVPGIIQLSAATREPLALSSSLTLVVESALDLPLVWADTERIAQAFANLIGNAAKFTSAGGSIKVRARAVARDVHFSVADTGPGVKEEDRTRVFAPFWQVDPGDRRGRGLGLWICRQIVEAHGGRIWIDSGPDGGAVFVFALRRSEGKPTGQDDVTHRTSPIRLAEEIESARRSTRWVMSSSCSCRLMLTVARCMPGTSRVKACDRWSRQPLARPSPSRRESKPS
jgi:hypothetical protein